RGQVHVHPCDTWHRLPAEVERVPVFLAPPVRSAHQASMSTSREYSPISRRNSRRMVCAISSGAPLPAWTEIGMLMRIGERPPTWAVSMLGAGRAALVKSPKLELVVAPSRPYPAIVPPRWASATPTPADLTALSPLSMPSVYPRIVS